MDFTLTATGDIAMVEGPSAARQRIHLGLGTNQGEWRFDLRVGVPWLFSVLGQYGDSAAIRSLIVDEIRQDFEVESIGELTAQFNRANRNISYQVPVRLTSAVV